MRALEHGLLASHARIVIAGSEGARGNMPGTKVRDIVEIADDHFDGDRVVAIEALARIEAPSQTRFANMDEYVTAKLVVACWVAAVARRLPDGMTLNALSPGANVGTSFGRDASLAMRAIMIPAMKLFGPLLGMNGPVDSGARRYLDAAGYGGHFYATAHAVRSLAPSPSRPGPSTSSINTPTKRDWRPSSN